MIEKQFENNFSENVEEFKYPIDFIEDKNKIAKIELGLSDREANMTFKVCEEDYRDAVTLLRKYAKKEGFKKIIITPFHGKFHTIPTGKNSRYFAPAKSIPRLSNLKKIIPDFTEDAIKSNVMHERQHCFSFAIESQRIEESKENVTKEQGMVYSKSIEGQTNLQAINNEVCNGRDINKIISSISKHYIFLNILTQGAEGLEIGTVNEKMAIEWFKYYYPFIKDKDHDEFISLFIKEFNICKDEVIKRYNKYIEENNINDFYNDEDKKCEELRVKAIDRLNEMAQ